MLNQELIDELEKEYDVDVKVIIKYYNWIKEDYPFVMDDDKLACIMHEILSNIPAAEFQNFEDNEKKPINERIDGYNKDMAKKIQDAVADYYDMDDSSFSMYI